jgi:hypothetical protein
VSSYLCLQVPQKVACWSIKTFNLQQIVLLPNQNPDNEVSFSAKSEHPIPLIPLSAFAGKGAKN